MKLGARDFLEKPLQISAMGDALDHTFANLDRQVDPYNQLYAARMRLNLLTPREKDVLRGLIGGMSNKALASELGLGVRTVEGHRASMLERLGVKTLSAALLLVFHANLDSALVD